MKSTSLAVLVFLTLLCSSLVTAQPGDSTSWAATVQNAYSVTPNITYLTANNTDLHIDIYTPRGTTGPTPTFIYIHGGGWIAGSKEVYHLRILPFLEAGWAVVNVQYRLGDVSRAPAAVEDCLCALRWVIRNAETYGFDSDRIVVSGNSAGGHLALTTGMIPAGTGLDNQCPGDEPLKVAAIVNWYGITDVGDLLGGDNERSYAVAWIGSQTDALEIATRVSPMTYVRADLPPVLTIHGNADPVVPYQHAVDLHQALDAAGVENQLITIPDGLHGNFPDHEMLRAYDGIFSFLDRHVD